ncbi:flavin reductase [Microbacterium invictum]|uniref:Flavin reductase (DIM6/NTAB) family NADH-FMN oxidoreductase RutF n=1 Tax=Microbacterium invictum TaxID=515415 RepID=A0AA40VNC9_9MICO|nr:MULTISPECIES: flavin reductase [Microbacterium]MBB4140283.1 flavin reductase (DIM6/NTAB) family NADH-FMN oxidoreductase RutF [Microbacterium invictum]
MVQRPEGAAVEGGQPDAPWYREVLGHFPTGVAVVTALDAERDPVAMVVGSFVSVSLDPPLVAYFPQKSSSTYARLYDSPRFVISVLAADQEQLCRRLASKDPRKLDGVPLRSTAAATPVIDGCVAWIECDLETRHDGGDHDIVVGRIVQMARPDPRLPLVFFQGGYGRFSPSSLVMPTEKDLIPALRAVEAARATFEDIAARAGHGIQVIARIADELVLLASAGGSGQDALASHVGRRMPHKPPLGALFVAEDDALADRWLSHARTDAVRGVYSAMLDRVRERGWSLAAADPWHVEWNETLKEFSGGVYTPSVERRILELIDQRAGDYEPEAGLAVESIRLLVAPVRDAEGAVVLEILLLDIGPDVDTARREELLALLLAGADDASKAISAL